MQLGSFICISVTELIKHSDFKPWLTFAPKKGILARQIKTKSTSPLSTHTK